MPPTPPRQPAMQASARTAAASAWLSGARWKLLAMRGTRAVPASLAEEALPEASRVTMRVFAEGCPAGCLREVIELLTAEREVRDPVVDGTVQPGLWRHRLAVWSRDGDSTKTVVRDFFDGELSFGAVVESGCSSETSVRYVFDAGEAEALPPFAQGTVVRIGGLSRDRETGFFSYYVTETVRKTRAVGFRVVSDTAFETVSEARWDGVYGTPEQPKTHLGESVTEGIPSAGVQPAGTTVSVQWDQDPQDCTWTASARKTVAKEGVPRGYSCDRDVFKTDHSSATSGADPDTVGEHAPGPDEVNGTVSSLSVQNRPDGLADVTAGVRTELTVPEAAVRVRGDVFRRSETVTGRSERWAEAFAKLGLAGASAGVLKSVDLSKTPSGRADTVVSTDTEIPVARARVTVSRDAFGTAEAVTGRSVDAAEPPVPSSFTPGELAETTAELTPGGRRDVSESKRVSTPYPDAEVTFSKTAFARQTRAAYRFARDRVAGFVAAARGFLYTQSSSAERDGTFTNTQEVTESIPYPNAEVTFSGTAFARQTRATYRFARARVAGFVAAARGFLYTQSSSAERDGTFTNTQEVTESIPYQDAEVTYSETEFAKLTRTAHRFARERVAGFVAAAKGFLYTQSSSAERDGTFTNTEEVTESIPYPDAEVTYSETAFAKLTRTAHRFARERVAGFVAAAKGFLYTQSSSAERDGTFTNTEEVTESISYPDAEVTYSETAFAKLTRTAHRFARARVAGFVAAARGFLYTQSSSAERDGTFTNTQEVTESIPYPDAEVTYSETAFAKLTRTAYRFARERVAGFVAAAKGFLYTQSSSAERDGTFTNTQEVTESVPYPDAEVTYSETAFAKLTRTAYRFARARVAGFVAAARGFLYTQSSSAERDGTFTNTEEVTESIPYPDAEVTYSETAFAKLTRTAHRFARERVADFVAAAKGSLYTQSSSAERDGTFTNTEELTESKPVENAVVTRSEDLFFARESAADRALRAEGPDPAAPAGGVVESLQRELNRDQTVDESRGTSTEKEVLEAAARYTVLPWMTLRTVSDRHTAAPHPVDGSRPGSVDFSRTPGALYDRSRTDVLPGSVSDGFVLKHTRGGDLFTDFEDIDTLWSYKSWAGLDTGLSGGGVEGGAKITTATFSAREDGTFIRSVRTESVKAHVWYEVRKTYRRFNTQTLGQDSCVIWSWSFSNASLQRVLNVFNSVSAKDIFYGLRFSYNMSYNKFGLMDGSIGVTTVTREEA